MSKTTSKSDMREYKRELVFQGLPFCRIHKNVSLIFFLEYAGELRIIALREKLKG